MNSFKLRIEPYLSRPFFVFLLIFMVVLAVYYSSLSYPFIFDDPVIVTQNPQVNQGFSGIPNALGFYRAEGGSWHFYPPYRPVRAVSEAIDFQFFNTNPAGHRFMNLVYHSLASLLVFLIALKLMNNPWASLLAALLFALHPVQTDSVTYISGRRDILAGLFFFSGFYSFIRWKETDKPIFIFSYFTTFLLALFSKEMAITLPIACILFEVIFRNERKSHKRGRWIFHFTGLALSVWFVYYIIVIVKASNRIEVASELSLKTLPAFHGYVHSVYQQILLSIKIFSSYLKLLVIPYPLVGDYSYNAFPVPETIWSWEMARHCLTCLLYVLILIRTRRNKVALFSLLLIPVTLLPVLQIIPHHEIFAEHYLYIPIFGYYAFLLFIQPFPKIKMVVTSLTLLFILNILLVSLRNAEMGTELGFWKTVVSRYPDSARGLRNLATQELKRNRLEDYLRLMQRAVIINETDPFHRRQEEYVAHLAYAYLKNDQITLAANTIEKAYRLNRSSALVNKIMALILVYKNQPEEAISYFKIAIEADPNDINSYVLLGETYQKLGDAINAQHMLRKAHEMEDMNNDSLKNIIEGFNKKKGQPFKWLTLN